MLPFKSFLVVVALLLMYSGKAAAPEHISPSPALNMARAGHTATLLTDGTVLIAGGCVANGCESALTDSTELFDPKQDRFITGAKMHLPRVGHVAVLLDSGNVLILGGWTGRDVSRSAELYNPSSKAFINLEPMLQARDGFTATKLGDGKVLIAGGYAMIGGQMRRLTSAEVFDPTTLHFKKTGELQVPRMSHSAVLLSDGKLLISGGSQSRGEVLSSNELYDPITEKFSFTAPLITARHKHAAVLLKNRQVLVIGGSSAGDFSGQFSSTELIEPLKNLVTSGPVMHAARFKIPNAIAQLSSGSVLIAGSDRTAEIYDANSSSFRVVAQELEGELSYSTVTALADGRALIAGGYDAQITVSARTWLYNSK